jgi:menaquinone-dependent protoporphyrinogen oxidase
MNKVLIVHASRHGGSKGIADRIGECLRSDGIEVAVVPASTQPDPREFDAVIVGSGVYMGSWLGEGADYLARHAEVLAERPVWLFSSGQLPGSTAEKDVVVDLYGGALGPAEGPGSGSRKKIEALAKAINARDHRVFRGAFDPNDPPRNLAERLVRMMPASKNLLPEGDFREWDLIEAWARQIATEIRGAAVPA